MLRIVYAMVLALVIATAPGLAGADSYPTKPIHIIVPYPAGGTSDILARTIGQRLSESLGQPVIVDNKPGANGNVGADLVAKANADGYTLLLADIGALVISPSVFPTLPFDPVKAFAPFKLVVYSTDLLVVHPIDVSICV